MTHILLKCERKWALKLRTYYPYGLNEKGFGGNNNSNTDKVTVEKIFPLHPKTGIRQIRSELQRNHVGSSCCKDFAKKEDDIFLNNLYNSFNMIHIMVDNTKKEILKDIEYSILNRSDEFNFLLNKKQ